VDGWRRLHNEELHILYTSLNIIRVIKSRRTRWAGHVARIGDMRNAYSILVVKPEGKRPLGRPRLDGRTVSGCVLGKLGGKLRAGFIWLKMGTSGRLL